MSYPEYRPIQGDNPGRMIIRDHGYLEYRFGPAATCEIVNIEVEPGHQGQGVGTDMLQELEQRKPAKSPTPIQVIYAFTAADNHRAHNWYRKNGFVLTRVFGFYGSRGDAFICVKVKPA